MTHSSSFRKVVILVLSAMMLMPQMAKALGGSGTSSSPYTISSAADLKSFRDKVNGGETTAYAKLTTDITSVGTWTPIGTSSKKYSGVFDGQGHTISGISLSYTTTYQGLFGYISGATIKRFTLSGTMSSSTKLTGTDDCVGTVVGRAVGASLIEEITSSVNLTISGVAQKHIGGIVGTIEGSSSVNRCTYSGTISASSSTDCLGGIVGFATASCSGSITNCCYSGSITAGSGPNLGGILGYTNDESNNFGGIQYCFAHGSLSYSGSNTYVNAIVGRIRNRATTVVNNYYYNSIATRAANTDGPSIPSTNDGVSLTACQAGGVTYALNAEGANTYWRQTIGSDNFPTLNQSHLRVYFVYNQKCTGGNTGNPFYSNNTTGSIVHTALTNVAAVQATCTTGGNDAYYKCTGCSKYFSDSEGTDEESLSTFTHAALGHNYYDVEQTICTRCNHYFLYYTASSKATLTNVSAVSHTFSSGKGTVELTSGTTALGQSAFANQRITSVTIPGCFTSLGMQSFSGCTSLSSVTLKSSVTSIGAECFSGCTSLKDFSFSSITSLGTHAFTNSGLTDVTIPSSLTSLGDGAFRGCGSLTFVYFDAGNTLTKIPNSLFQSCTSLEDISLGNLSGLKTIGTGAFSGCSALTNFSIPSSVTAIEAHAFSSCSLNSNNTLPSSLRTIGEGAFRNNPISYFTIPSKVTSIGNNAFADCSNLSSVTFPSATPPTLGSGAFNSCKSTLHLSVPCANIAAYRAASGWSAYNDKIESAYLYTLQCKLASDSEKMGKVEVTQAPDCDNHGAAIVTAVPYTNYRFTQWEDGSTINPRSVSVTSNTTVTASFVYALHTITGVASPAEGGSVLIDEKTGSNNLLYGDGIMIEAKPAPGYEFVTWQDGNTENPRYVDVFSDMTYTATFKKAKYTITVPRDDSYTLQNKNTSNVEYGTTGTLTVTPKPGYEFVSWDDGNTENPRKVVVTESRTYTPTVSPIRYTVRASCDHGSCSVVDASSGESMSYYGYSQKVKLTVTPSSGYEFQSWSDGNTDNPRIITINAKTPKLAQYQATCKGIDCHFVLSADLSDMGTVSYVGPDSIVHTGTHLEATLPYNTQVTITATPASPDYKFVSWQNGIVSNPSAVVITEDKTYTARFATTHTPCAVLADSVLTFYCDGLEHEGTTYEIDSKFFSAWRWNLSQVHTVVFDESFAKVRPTSLSSWFYNGYNIKTFRGLENLNTSNVTDMGCAFYNCSSVDSLDLSHFDTRKVKRMDEMFYKCNALKSLDVSSFCTDSVSNMYSMFRECKALTSLDVSSFRTANVSNMRHMFDNCMALTSLDVSSFNTANVSDMSKMFNDCMALTSLDVSSFNTANVSDMSNMFNGCKALTSLDVSSFRTDSVTNMNTMFFSCEKLESLDLSTFNTEKVTNMGNMFGYCNALKSLDLSSFNTKSVTDMRNMFNHCYALTSVNLSSFNTEKVTDMGYMFNDCRALTSLDLSSFNTKSVTDMGYMFSGCNKLDTLTVRHFDMTSVTNSSGMFTYGTDIKHLICRSMVNFADGTFNTQFSDTGVTVDYILDDDSYNATVSNLPSAITSISYTRTVNNALGTLVLPFDIDTEDCPNCEFYEMHFEQRNDDFSIEGENYEGIIPANTPVMFRVKSEVTDSLGFPLSLTFTGKTDSLTNYFQGSVAKYVNGSFTIEYQSVHLAGSAIFLTDNMFISRRYNPLSFNPFRFHFHPEEALETNCYVLTNVYDLNGDGYANTQDVKRLVQRVLGKVDSDLYYNRYLGTDAIPTIGHLTEYISRYQESDCDFIFQIVNSDFPFEPAEGLRSE